MINSISITRPNISNFIYISLLTHINPSESNQRPMGLLTVIIIRIEKNKETFLNDNIPCIFEKKSYFKDFHRSEFYENKKGSIIVNTLTHDNMIYYYNRLFSNKDMMIYYVCFLFANININYLNNRHYFDKARNTASNNPNRNNDLLYVLSWNVNSIRSNIAKMSIFKEIDKIDPDMALLQEIKTPIKEYKRFKNSIQFS